MDTKYCSAGNSMEWIDLENWDRKLQFRNYLGTDLPYIIITANVDVTKPLDFAHRHGVSFNMVMVYLCTKVIDSIKNYRYRFADGKPFIIDHTRPLVNHLVPGTEHFVIAEGPWPCDDILEFCRVTHERALAARPDEWYDLFKGTLDHVNFTSIPWIQYTGFVRTIKHDGVDNAPKMSFGKYFRDPEGRVMMPVSSQTHHGLMDGYHVGLFYERLQKACDELE
ncbi:MAG: hypothetical protein IKH67_01030 [Lachnospiraceae bacterium]|nr:hypothetical protein [Lachnospiraceae bacterium]